MRQQVDGTIVVIFGGVECVRASPQQDRVDDEQKLDVGKVAVVPGSGFGAPGFVRLSYATSMKNIEAGVARIAETLAALS